jgi:hypothetical protein
MPGRVLRGVEDEAQRGRGPPLAPDFPVQEETLGRNRSQVIDRCLDSPGESRRQIVECGAVGVDRTLGPKTSKLLGLETLAA